ncbi:MAG: Holliday junction resolvase RuvX [Phycisphaeraceae bacterium]
MPRYLAIDPGDKRTGLASGDDVSGLVTPIGAIVTGSLGERLRQILKHIDEQGPDALVLGLPLNMDGTEGPRARKARELAERLREATGLEVHLADERLSSVAADEQMAQSGLTHKQKKARRDALAAAAILREFLRGGGGRETVSDTVS